MSLERTLALDAHQVDIACHHFRNLYVLVPTADHVTTKFASYLADHLSSQTSLTPQQFLTFIYEAFVDCSLTGNTFRSHFIYAILPAVLPSPFARHVKDIDCYNA